VLAIGPLPAGRPERTQRLPSGPYGVGPDQFGAAVGFGGTGSGAMFPSQNSPDDQHHEGSMATDLMVAQINQHPFPAPAYSCRGRGSGGDWLPPGKVPDDDAHGRDGQLACRHCPDGQSGPGRDGLPAGIPRICQAGAFPHQPQCGVGGGGACLRAFSSNTSISLCR
jgi:hypothetical protein